jgi:hypothetical protein
VPDVVVRRDRADVVRDAAHMEVLGNLLLVKEAVVATAHSEEDTWDFLLTAKWARRLVVGPFFVCGFHPIQNSIGPSLRILFCIS